MGRGRSEAHSDPGRGRTRRPTDAISIGIQGALEEVAATLQPGEQLCAFLDDIYAPCQPDRVKAISDTLAECLFRVAGIRLHQGKTRVWNRGGVQPADVALLGPDVWEPQGVMVLGTPIGSPQFTADRLQTRIEEEQRLWEAIPHVSDLQCGWHILPQNANPPNHTLRTVPPSLIHEHVVGAQHAILGQICRRTVRSKNANGWSWAEMR